jgi:hypothetical protein
LEGFSRCGSGKDLQNVVLEIFARCGFEKDLQDVVFGKICKMNV